MQVLLISAFASSNIPAPAPIFQLQHHYSSSFKAKGRTAFVQVLQGPLELGLQQLAGQQSLLFRN